MSKDNYGTELGPFSKAEGEAQTEESVAAFWEALRDVERKDGLT